MASAVASVLALLILAATPALGHADGTTYTRAALVKVPGNPLNAFDIGWVDPSSQRYFLADRSNKGVDVVDARTNMFVRRISARA